MSYKRAVRSPLWFACEHDSASADLHRLKTNFVLSGIPPPDADIKTYDIGNLFVAIESDGAAQSAGELYVEYVVDLLTPQISNDPPSFSLYQENGAITGGNFNVLSLGPAAITVGPNDAGQIPVTYQPGTNPLLQEDFFIGTAGYYLVTIRYVSTLASAQGNQVSVTNRQTALNALEGQATQLSGGQNFSFAYYLVQVQDTEDIAFTLQFAGLSGAPTAGVFNLYITPLSTASIILSDGSPFLTKVNPRARLGRIRV